MNKATGVVCRNCGCIPPIENATKTVSGALKNFRINSSIGLVKIVSNKFVLLWVMALVPVVMATAFAAALYSAFQILSNRSNIASREVWIYASIFVVALINMKLSFGVLHELMIWGAGYFGYLKGLFDGYFYKPHRQDQIMDAAINAWHLRA